jgi:hypothetical protein
MAGYFTYLQGDRQMNRKLSWLTLAAAVLVLAACSSSNVPPPAAAPPPAAPPPPPATTMVSGAVVDAFVINSTVTAYPVSSAGVVGACIPATPATTPATCATATTDSSGGYTVNLGSYSGAVMLQATGGSYTDTVTRQTVALPTGLALSVLLPSVSPGTTAVSAQITPMTTMAAQFALQQASQGTALATAIQNSTTSVEGYFGGLGDLANTALLDLTQAGCGAAASQASFDASLILAGISQLASQYNVTSAQLELAILQDVISDGMFDGTNAGVPIMVPLASGSGSVALTTIYASSLAQSIEASIATFETSTANACNAQQSGAAKTRLTQQQSQQVANSQYSYSISGTYTLTGNYITAPRLIFSVSEQCQSAGQNSGPPTLIAGVPSASTPQAFSGVTSYTNLDDGTAVTFGSNSDLNWTDSCGSNAWTLTGVKPVVGQVCTVSSGASATGTFTSTDGGNHNTGADPTAIAISCSISSQAITGSVNNLAPGTTLTITATDATTSADSSTAVATGSAVSPQTLNFINAAQQPASALVGDTITLTASVTQPSSGTQTCNIFGGASISVPAATPVTVSVTCSTAGAGGPASALNGPGGMVFYNNLLYVANGGNNQVLVFSEQTSGSTFVGLTQVAIISSPHMTDPARLAMDANGDLYVASLGTGNGAGTVTVFNTTNNNVEVTAAGGGAILSGLDRPLGIAVDSGFNIYVADNAGNSVSVYAPTTQGSPAAGYAAPMAFSQDAGQHPFLAPGVIFEEDFSSVVGAGNDYVLVGLGPGSAADSVILYKDPFTSAPLPLFDLTNSTCSSMPSGPTGIALFPNQTSLSAGGLLSSVIYVASFYNNNVDEYLSNEFFPGLGGSTANTCPTPIVNGNGMNKPEGIAVDALGNVFVSNAAGNTITVYTGGSSFANEAPIYTYPSP